MDKDINDDEWENVKKYDPNRNVRAKYNDDNMGVYMEPRNDGGWVKIWPMADVFVHEPGNKNELIDSWEGWLTLEIQFPDDFENDIYFFKKDKPRELFLVYYDKNAGDRRTGKGQWVLFTYEKNQAYRLVGKKWEKMETEKDSLFELGGKNKFATIRIKRWIKDPPVGWGGRGFP